MIQLCDVYYLRRLKKEMDKRGLIDKFAKRFIAISRNEQQWDNIKDEVLNTFDTDEEKRIFKISDISKYQASNREQQCYCIELKSISSLMLDINTSIDP